jgi:hypothetical protein
MDGQLDDTAGSCTFLLPASSGIGSLVSPVNKPPLYLLLTSLGWIAQFLSYFVFACWIAPQNVIVNQVFGGVSGLGLVRVPPGDLIQSLIEVRFQSPLIGPLSLDSLQVL